MARRAWQFLGLASGQPLSADIVGTTQDVQLVDQQLGRPTTLWLKFTDFVRQPRSGSIAFAGTMRYGADLLSVTYDSAAGGLLQEI